MLSLSSYTSSCLVILPPQWLTRPKSPEKVFSPVLFKYWCDGVDGGRVRLFLVSLVHPLPPLARAGIQFYTEREGHGAAGVMLPPMTPAYIAGP